ncbi:TetR/AcrR family transcriptional regulator [Pseudonocardia hydrocarbonoxydans]|uniref:TetR family transcriptional regulator n=1 Tax=Pseudonocardia hydrocarbonoxydans TaxID=76726 RepID=A0A4Y3WNI9_9PSEU|nr:TetR/AcrR family transcriptional regulator [Pseudonocardia hydrocarbonoxydans]GEC20487.1 TetR family transcriptional regulator [Pseudonocardia hydrocarbonoxydans]
MPRPKVHDEALRERLLDRAGALLAGGGPDALSLRVLAQECGTSTTAVYALFGGKPALLDVVAARAARDLALRLAAVEPADDPVEHLARLATAYREAALGDPYLHGTALTTAVLPPFAHAVRRALADARSDADPSTVALAVQALVHGLVDLERHGLAADGGFPAALHAALDGWLRPTP